jgi:hypothetical protein
LQRYGGEMDPEFYQRTAAALISLLRRCPNLTKISLLGDTLHSVNPADLLPFGPLLRELESTKRGRPVAYGQAISNLLANCGNLEKLRYERLDREQDLLVFAPQSCPLLTEMVMSLSDEQQEEDEEEEEWEQLEGQQQVPVADIFTLIGRSCKHLRKLHVINCGLSARSLRSIAGMEAVRDLYLDGQDDLTDAGMTALATMRLVSLRVLLNGELSLDAFVESNISQTLESFDLSVHQSGTPVDDVQVALGIASCRSLKKLTVRYGIDDCVFGRNGLDGLQAMAAGCPLLADVYLYLTVPGLHCLGAHFANLKKCRVLSKSSDERKTYPPIETLQTLYPAVEWSL